MGTHMYKKRKAIDNFPPLMLKYYLLQTYVYTPLVHIRFHLRFHLSNFREVLL